MLWLTAYLMGLPPTGLYTLCWTHGQTPMLHTAMLEAERIAKDPTVKGYHDVDEFFADLDA